MKKEKAARLPRTYPPGPPRIVKGLDPQFLPPELISMIMKDLTTKEVANFRYLCRNVAEVGKEHLVPVLHLQHSDQSFDKMRKISEDPDIRRGVKELVFEGDSLPHFTQEAWALVIERVKLDRPKISKQLIADTLQLIHAPPNDCIPTQKDLYYRLYRDSAVYQRAIRLSSYYTESLRKALKLFSNIHTLQMSVYGKRQPASRAFLRRCYRNRLFPDPETHRGTSEIRSLMVGAFQAQTKLKTFCCSSVNWKFLYNYNDMLTWKCMLQSIRSLEHLELGITSAYGTVNIPGGRQTNDCEECLELLDRRRLSELISAAPKLRSLSIGFGGRFEYYLPGVNLVSVVGTFHWINLQKVSFHRITAKDNQLVEFCKRHSDTLRHLSLRDMTIPRSVHPTGWREVLKTMRQVSDLEVLELRGSLVVGAIGDTLFWRMPWNTKYPTTNFLSQYVVAKDLGEMTLDEYHWMWQEGGFGDPSSEPWIMPGFRFEEPS